MRRLAGCVALAMMLGSSPLAAEQGPVAPEATKTAEPGLGKAGIIFRHARTHRPSVAGAAAAVASTPAADHARSEHRSRGAATYRHRERQGEARLADLIGPRRLCHQNRHVPAAVGLPDVALPPIRVCAHAARGLLPSRHGVSRHERGRPARPPGLARLRETGASKCGDALQVGAQARLRTDQGASCTTARRAKDRLSQPRATAGARRLPANRGSAATRASAATMAAPPPIGPTRPLFCIACFQETVALMPACGRISPPQRGRGRSSTAYAARFRSSFTAGDVGAVRGGAGYAEKLG